MPDLQSLTTQIVANFLEGNKLPPEHLPGLIAQVYGALSSAENPAAPEAEAVEKPSSYQIRKSVQPEHIISFLDGKPYKTLKRHLATHDMTFEQYRERFGLPKDYPSTAPAYSARRSELAKALGLGQGGRGGKAAAAAAPAKTSKKGKGKG